MKPESIEKLKQRMVETYRKFGDEKALLIRVKPGKNVWTGHEIAEEIENENEFGIHIVDNLIQLTIYLLSRDKINMTFGEALYNGDKVKCSDEEDFKEFWYGTYIGKHPTKEAHIILCRARPELRIGENVDTFTYCQRYEWGTEIFVIYDNPSDYPGKFVVVR